MPSLVVLMIGLLAASGACADASRPPVAAGAVVSTQDAAALHAEFDAAWTAFERAGAAEGTRRVRRIVELSGRLLTSRGVLWHAAAAEQDVLVVTPVRTGAALNEFAWRVKRELEGLAVVFDPWMLKDENAGALYDEETHRLLISAQEVASGRLSDYIEHELVHARHYVALAKGRDTLFSGWIRRLRFGRELDPAYPERFSLDELQAYAAQARANLGELRRVDGHGDFEGTVEMLHAGARLARITASVASQAGRLLARLGPLDPGVRTFSDERLVDDHAVRVSGLRGRDGALHVRTGEWPAWVRGAPPLTHAVVEVGEVALEFVMPIALRPDIGAQDVRLLRGRAERVASCAQRIAAAFEAIRVRLEAGDLVGAADRAHALEALALRGESTRGRASCAVR